MWREFIANEYRDRAPKVEEADGMRLVTIEGEPLVRRRIDRKFERSAYEVGLRFRWIGRLGQQEPCVAWSRNWKSMGPVGEVDLHDGNSRSTEVS